VLSLAAGTSADTTTAAPGEDGDHSHADAVEESPGGLALFLAILALLTGIAGVVLGWRATRRTVSS
jgi:hypothetical protein